MRKYTITAVYFSLSTVFVLVIMSGIYTQIDSDTRAQISRAFFGPYSDNRDASWHTASGDELVRASNEHFNIALQISHCFPNVHFTWGNDGPPAAIAITFMLNMQPNGEQTWNNIESATPDINLTNFSAAF